MELPKNTWLTALALMQQLILLLLLPSFSSAQLQPHHPYYHHQHPRSQLYYEAPRLRRYEYAPSSYISGYPLAASAAPGLSLAGHFQQQTPNFQLINYRPSYQPLALEYQQQQPPLPVPAPALPSIYPQPSVQYQQRSIAPHMELAKYRYEGNYLPVHRVQAGPVPPLQQPQHQQQQLRRVEEEPLQQLYNVPPALFTSDVLHVLPPRIARLQEQHQQPQQQHQQPQQQQQQPQTERSRRNAQVDLQADAEASETRSQQKEAPPIKETKYFHDIFMRFDGPHSRSHGHVLKQPKAEERRFEMQRGTNRYKGEVIWTDRQGSHGEHRWDMAQGKL